MADKLFIPLIVGTSRKGSYSQKVAEYLSRELEEDADIELKLVSTDIDAAKTQAPWGSEEKPKHHEDFMRADAFIVVVPEYNRGYPGELKLLLDSMYEEYKYKPFGLCGVSSGPAGGAQVIEHIKPVLIEFGGVPIKRSMRFGVVKELFDEEGNMADVKMSERVAGFIKELKWYTRTLKYGRENIEI